MAKVYLLNLARSFANASPLRWGLLLICTLAGPFTAAVFALPARQSPPASQTAPPTIAQAQALLAAGRIDAAISMLKALPRSESDSLPDHLLGVAYYQRADYGRAVEYLTAALKRAEAGGSQYRQAVQLLGLSHYLLGHTKEAIPYLEQVKNWAPDNVEMAYTLGISYIQTHSPDKSRAAFARMFAVAPDSPTAYLINAQMMVRQQFEEFAEKELRKALELDPRLPQAHFLLGELAIYKAQVDLGIELLQKEIALNPAFAMAYYRLGEAYTRQQKWDEAIGPLQKSIWLSPFFSGPYIVLGKAYLKKGDLSNAESILRRAITMDPNNYSGHHLLAQVFQQANRPEEAKREFEIAERLRAKSDK